MVAATAGRAGDPAGSGNAAQPDYAGLFTRLEQADAVVEGARPAKSLLYVLFDANCYYCQLTWKALQAYETAGLQVHWVPVAFQQASSVGRAAAIMQAANRGAALRENETGYKVAQFDGGIRPLDKTPAELAARFEANTRLMRSFGAPGTPVLVWKDGGGRVHTRIGMPRLSELPEITRLPLQPNADPELAKYR
ncbi:MAG TPA: thioredoxin fold domain-containing protein [Bradyrhizobium sp.]|nr:thioredoxin fold domain-containing protein [Bradyrhizobium sp.]